MNLSIKKGTYVVAVSGGVDSMSLLHMLANGMHSKQSRYVVAHYNHGIRKESDKDEVLVRKVTLDLGLVYEVGHGRLGANAGEAVAREARYKFLEQVRQKHTAHKIVTAHHQDDMLETSIINLIRGTGRRGFSAIADNPRVERPLLNFSKAQIKNYALENNLKWVEDESNQNKKYLRNLVRHEITPQMTGYERNKFNRANKNFLKLNKEIDKNIAKISHYIIKSNSINRYEYTLLPSQLSKELLIYWLRANDVGCADRSKINALDNYIRTTKTGSIQSVTKGHRLVFSKSGETVSLSP